MAEKQINTHKIVTWIAIGFVTAFAYLSKDKLDSLHRADLDTKQCIREAEEKVGRQNLEQWKKLSELQNKVSYMEGFRDGFLKSMEVTKERK